MSFTCSRHPGSIAWHSVFLGKLLKHGIEHCQSRHKRRVLPVSSNYDVRSISIKECDHLSLCRPSLIYTLLVQNWPEQFLQPHKTYTSCLSLLFDVFSQIRCE